MGKPGEFSEDELAGLGDAERAALADDDEGEGNDDGEGAGEGEGEGGAEGEGGPGEGEGEGGEGGEGEGEAPAAAAAADGEADPDLITDDEPFVPQLAVAPPADFTNKVAEINTQIAALREKLENGDITLSEYEADKDRLVEDRSELTHQQRMADFAAEQNAQQSKMLWEHEQKKFFKAEANQPYMADPLLFSVLNEAVKTIANNPKNANMGPDEVLAEADKQVRSRLIVGKPDPNKPKPPERGIDRSKLPKSLRELPAAEIPETGEDGEFSHLDKLTGLDLEKAIARMTPEQQDRWARG